MASNDQALTQTQETERAQKGTKKRKPRRQSVPMRHVLLTGYPGFIGQRLAERILAEKKTARLSLLVQEKFRDDAERYLARLPQAQAKRAAILVGDVAQIDLGLSGPEIEHLSASVTHVFHLAAVQYLGVSEDETERVNVGGTRNVLSLAREMKALKRLVHFSSCYVSGDRIGVIIEDELDEGQRFRNAYERTKYRAEKLVRASMGSLPITVLRPSIVVGDSETGEIDRMDGIYMMGMFIVTSPVGIPLPLPGDGVAPLNVVPVDFVTRAALLLATKKETVGQTFHLVDPNPLSARHVYELIAKRAGKRLPQIKIGVGKIGVGFARRLLRMPIIERFGRDQAQALDYLNHLAIYNCAGTLQHLEGTGVLCPRIDTYVDRLMDYVRDHFRQREDAAGPRLLKARTDPFA